MGPNDKNQITFANDDGEKVEPKLNKDFRPLSFGGSGNLDTTIVFAGYGISSKDDKYDDYEGIDVKDKAVILLRHEPQQNNPHGPFQGTRDSAFAALTKKVSNAYQHGAVAVIFVTDEYEITKEMKSQKKLLGETLDKLTKENEKLKKLSSDDLEAQEAAV